MTVLMEKPPSGAPASSPVQPRRQRNTFIEHVSAYRADYIIVTVLALLALATRGYNLANYPGWFVDEGVYVSQAWSVYTGEGLAPYTYWYDHPPLGWIQIAVWFFASGAFIRYGNEPMLAGREFMVVMAMATAVLLYVLARRLGARRVFAVLVSLLWIASPLAISFSRMVLLDNITVPWMLAAMVLILSPKRRLKAVAGASVCIAVGVLSKETLLLMVPVFIYMGWQHYRNSPNRKDALALIITMPLLAGLTYPLYALIKGELVPGAGHVSLWDGVLFQLVSRQGSGNLLDPSSAVSDMVKTAWLNQDIWLPAAGVAALLPALCFKRLRGPAIGLAILLAMLFTGGYVPYPFVIMLLPLFALLFGTVLDKLWPTWAAVRVPGWRKLAVVAGMLVVVGTAIPFSTMGGGTAWAGEYNTQATADRVSTQRQAIEWVNRHVPKDGIIVTEGAFWTDLVTHVGFPQKHVVWDYKLDTDPDVMRDIGSPGNINYLLVEAGTLSNGNTQADSPTLMALAQKAQVVASFGGDGPGKILVMAVRH